tara:strand:+ start:336 stop:776 length:441 start_codon:yes stop_codon:yes gene_type:complete
MSARANSSAKAKRAGGATMENNNNNKFDDNSVNSTCSINQNKQPISVKQAIILLNTKVNTLSQMIVANSSGNLSNNNVEIGTLEMRSSELQKRNELLSTELATLKQSVKKDLDGYKNSLNDVKDMVLKLQSSVTDLQGTVLKLNKN